MVISSTLACFHSTPPLPLMTTEEELNGLIPQRYLEGEDTSQMFRDKRSAGVTQREARDINGSVASFVMCASTMYSVCVCVNKKKFHRITS